MVRKWKSVLGGAGAVLFFFAAFNSATVAWVHGLGVGAFSTLTLGAGAATATSITQSGTGNFLMTLGGASSILNFRNSGGTSLLQINGTSIAAQEPLTFPSSLVVSGAGNTGNSAILLNKTITGTWTGSGDLSLYSVATLTDSVTAASADAVEGQQINMLTGGVNAVGGRHTAEFDMKLTATSGNTGGPTGATYSALNTKCLIQANDNGSAPTASNSRGFCYGFNSVSGADAGATNLTEIVSNEADVYVAAGATTMDKIGYQVVQITPDAVQGTRDDVALAIVNQPGTVGWANLLEFGRQGGVNPCAATCTLIYATGNLGTALTATTGIDFTNATFSGNAFQSNAFSVTQAGVLTASAYKVGATAGVDCSGVTAGTVTVAKGIVTHC